MSRDHCVSGSRIRPTAAEVIADGPTRILEIKLWGGMPDWLAEALEGISPAPNFSKFRMGMMAMAQQVGLLTPFRSLELSCDTVLNVGTCDTEYACVYQHNLAWSSPTTPLTPEVNPRSYLPDNGPIQVEDHGDFIRTVQPTGQHDHEIDSHDHGTFSGNEREKVP